MAAAAAATDPHPKVDAEDELAKFGNGVALDALLDGRRARLQQQAAQAAGVGEQGVDVEAALQAGLDDAGVAPPDGAVAGDDVAAEEGGQDAAGDLLVVAAFLEGGAGQPQQQQQQLGQRDDEGAHGARLPRAAAAVPGRGSAPGRALAGGKGGGPEARREKSTFEVNR